MADFKKFAEIAESCTSGYSIFHRVTYKHPEDECLAWQKGINNLCEWLDKEGYIVVNIPRNGLASKIGLIIIRIGEIIASF